MRILVTGGAGFIGSHLCKELLEQGHAVVCLDNFFTGSQDNIEALKSNTNFSVDEHDIIDPYFDDGQIDQIYNLACPASPVHYQKNPIRTIKANTIGVINMLGLAKKHKARILQASTSEVYGDPTVHPQPETYRGDVNPIGPRACYDEGKRCAETLFFDYHRAHGVEIRVARIFNTYGPNMAIDDGRVVSNFITQAIKGVPITIYGDGQQTRSFCYVDDMVKGLIALMNSNDTGPINLGNPEEFTMRELADEVIALTETQSTVENKPLPQDDPKQRQPDITKAKTVLKWEPKVKLAEGLPKTIEYFKSKLK
ncbi:MAG: NAD-dependent dehydratase [Candidatus Buchananbacteria bacterium CG10_big_fil_rev_8_21_14_0_10_42_9]|uniref:UDP-glucuronate decarboxylase n=1 Tax=Candidatus Buchananbacteria bacterium CG10_big_fil_rev_8_21_14_0_10_42_9 TaxID=1974526 RepID=A0A2H0W1Y6_9BACT|nr:MAG: NAD-dependent dehydratase [Candidatus Buchananbacteria bacterium CG10_big_fil_rev_8_21_14_0_10_42_9]